MADILLELCRQGDRAAQRQFYEKHVGRVFGLCVRILANREKAKDAVQETFIKAFSRLGQFRSESEIGTWLYRIATNACLDMVRQSRAKMISMDDERFGPVSAVTAAEKPSHEKSPVEEVVRKLLSTINRERAATFWLFTIHQLSQKDIARIQNISLATVKMRLAKVRGLLKEKLKGMEI
jgi:RNA polymerase sigma-70 factor (ECF subfamily)